MGRAVEEVRPPAVEDHERAERWLHWMFRRVCFPATDDQTTFARLQAVADGAWTEAERAGDDPVARIEVVLGYLEDFAAVPDRPEVGTLRDRAERHIERLERVRECEGRRRDIDARRRAGRLEATSR